MKHFDMDRNGIINGIDFLILDELLFPKDYDEEDDIYKDIYSSDDDDSSGLW